VDQTSAGGANDRNRSGVPGRAPSKLPFDSELIPTGSMATRTAAVWEHGCGVASTDRRLAGL